MRTYVLAAMVCVFVMSVPALAEDCGASQAPKDGIVLQSITGQPATFRLINPLPADAATIKENSIKVCWMNEQDLLDGTECGNSAHPMPLPIVLGICTVEGNKAVDNFPPMGLTPENLKKAQASLIRFNPEQRVDATQYLRVQWQLKDNATPTPKVVKVTTKAGVARFDEDSRDKLWLHTGYSLMRSQNDFQDSFPELRLRAETRLVDERIAMKHHEPDRYQRMVERQKVCSDTEAMNLRAMTRFRACRPWFTILRVYAETGLTNVTAQASTDTSQPTVTKSRNAFDGSLGVGWGKTLLVTKEGPEDTDAFSLQGILRLGLISIPAKEIPDGDGTKTTLPGGTRYSWLIGPRIENESGHFQGAYFEIGVGQSDQFQLKKVPRMRADGLLPVNDPGGLFRIAGRVQVDTARPFAKVKKNGLENSTQGEIRVSILVNFDLME